ncbi:MAG: hypothetical protein JSV91_15475 [Phycisphaerales bacterium]|nr:MAG: hypothetical protein JSV91_15475 [Phycisphaerales bacterium]
MLSAQQAVVKGALESEAAVALIAGPRSDCFDEVFVVASDEGVGELLKVHGARATPTPDAARAVTLAHHAARSGHGALALVPNEQLNRALPVIARTMEAALERGGAIGLLLEDDPDECPALCPRETVRRLELPSIEPANVVQLRDAMEQAMRLSRAGRGPVGIVVHSSILRSAESLEARPNRMTDAIDLVLSRRRRRRRPGWAETGGFLRMVRRLELNRTMNMPSPGERVPIGFITVGPTAGALRHLTHVLRLFGRVPMLHLGVVEPLDGAAVERILSRCAEVVVLEPRPGVLEGGVLAIAEQVRRSGHRPAAVSGSRIPPDAEGLTRVAGVNQHLHPSILARNIMHLLHAIRPTVQVASQLAPDVAVQRLVLPPRGKSVGAQAAAQLVRRMIADLDQWLREQAPLEEEEIEPSALAVEGMEAAGEARRLVQVEVWDARQFQNEGTAALRQAARDGRPWLFLICDVGTADGQDLERMARAAVPARHADRVRIVEANLSDRIALRDKLREAALLDRLSVVIARDGPPVRYDTLSLERSFSEVDSLGFEPRQRVTWRADEACAIRPPTDETHGERGEAEMRSEFSADHLPRRLRGQFRIRVRPLLEQVQVLRTRPPARAWEPAGAVRLPMPSAIHGRQAQWRAHLAGFRGQAPGAAARVLCLAGHYMGYAVKSTCNPTTVGAGRRAWSQVLFAGSRDTASDVPITAMIPYGEADLLLGLDVWEALRSLGPDPALRVAQADRTSAVVNVGLFGDQADDEQMRVLREQLAEALDEVTDPEHRITGDYAGACRAWFHTDRVADVAMLGAAYQAGLVPVSQEAIEAALAAMERMGFGRSLEAFQFGRRLAVDDRFFSRSRDDRQESVARILRRTELSMSRRRRPARRRAGRFGQLVRDTLAQMPGLAETERGRQARRDAVMAMHRCLAWGGQSMARWYADLITALYEADRGDKGRSITRDAILPLADAVLIHDPVYVATMAASTEQRRRTRQRLNIKRAREDRLERRYLTRLEFVGFGRRFRADVRTSDWPARLAAMGRFILPRPLRGTRRDREVRELVVEFIRRAAEGAGHNYDRFAEAMHRLHEQALTDRLRGMAPAEVRMLLGGAEESPKGD